MGLRVGTATLRNRVAMLGLGGVAITVALVNPSGIAKYFELFTAIAAPIIAIHLDTVYVHKATKEGAVASILIVLAFAFYWQVLSGIDIATQNVAIPLAFVTLYGVSFVTKLTGPWWDEERRRRAADQAAAGDEDLKREVLNLMLAGRNTLADLTDSVEGLLASESRSFAVQSMSTSELARYLDHLVDQGLVRRSGQRGRDVVTYELTDAGADWLSQQGATPPDKLDANARLVLEAATDTESTHVVAISEKTGLSPGEIVPIFNQLTEANYASAHGILRYSVKPTERGRELIAEAQVA
jgi:hypothetical protein